MNFKDLIYKIDVGIEEFLLFLIIILNILDFTELLPPEYDFIKKIISWTCLGYLLYKSSLTNIFFGEKIPKIDFLLVLAYFCLIVKNLIVFAQSVIDETGEFTYSLNVTETGFQIVQKTEGFLTGFYSSLINNGPLIEQIFFYIGISILIFLAIAPFIIGLRIKRPSVLGLFFDEEEKSANPVLKFIAVLGVYIGFFVIVLNLVMEWLAIAVDAPLLVIAIFAYFFIVLKHKEKFHNENIIYKLGSVGEGFYEKFINLFKYREKIFLGIVGMLVLHLLTDIGNFIVPYLTGIHDPLYFEQLGRGGVEVWLYALLKADLGLVTAGLDKGFIIASYILNVIGVLALLLFPAYIWFGFYKDMIFKFRLPMLALYFSSVTAFMLMPLFKFKRVDAKNLYGVDILIQRLRDVHAIDVFLYAVITIFIAVLLLGLVHAAKELFISLFLL